MFLFFNKIRHRIQLLNNYVRLQLLFYNKIFLWNFSDVYSLF